jgi:hypothetical protein
MASRLARVLGGASAVAAAFLVLPASCSNSEAELADEQVGKVDQRCFVGNTCDPGLTCVALPIPADGSSLGTDGGQCFKLDSGAPDSLPEAEPDAEPEAD